MQGVRRSFWKSFGPGLLFAGAAVGVSHQVQSTRAGAGYGLGLIGVVLLANLLKYPAFRFGSHYAAATGTSLLEGYRRQGKLVLGLYALLTLGTMFTVTAAVTVVTAGLLGLLLGVQGHPIALSAVLLAACGGLLAVGRFAWLDRVIKVVVAVLTVSTVAAAALALPRIDFAQASFWPDLAQWTRADFAFAAALVGWMPSAVDIAVWQSLWTLAKRDATGGSKSAAMDVRAVLLDFDIGYIGTALLAVCFVLLGAAVMFGKGVAPAASAGGFAAQIVSLYAGTLGAWSAPLIGGAAFAVMLSTTLTVVDGFPRAIAVLVQRFGRAEQAGELDLEQGEGRRAYWSALVVLAIGSLFVLALLLKTLAALVDLATTLSFLSAPVLAWLNHRAATAVEVPPALRPGRAMRLLSWLGILFLGAFALAYLWMRST
ncbi:MAG: divalent metal cation transporter [Deltaproteobacteria bacterium]|nr:divalent metal cation transporter [Deltaproteobacteria bacterium]